MGRRIKLFKVVPVAILLFCKPGGPIALVKNPLPDDARVVGTAIDGRGDIVLTVSSRTFPEVDATGGVPEVDAPRFERCFAR